MARSATKNRPALNQPSPNGTNGQAGAVLSPSTAVATVGPATANQGANGRFLPGNRAAAGNPFHRAVAARRKALLDAVTDEDIAAVARKLRDLALAGDVAAAKVLLVYVVGKPTAADDPDRLDLDELRLREECPRAGYVKLYGRVDPAFAAAMIEEHLCKDGEGYRSLLRESLNELRDQMRPRRGGDEALDDLPDDDDD
jgi:hypothetical protein